MNLTALRVTFMTLIGLLLVPATALAHPGHATVAASGILAGFVHPFTGLDHILAMIAVGIWASQLGGRALWVVPAAFVGLMLLGGTLGMAGLGLPQIQAGILVSILVLGFLIAGAFKLPVGLAGLLVGVFALFHGSAHGSEMPLAVSALGYSLGFALASISLHAGGLLTGILLRRFRADHINRLAGGAIVIGGLYLAIA